MNNPFSELTSQDPKMVFETLLPLTDRAVSIILYFLPTDSSKSILKSFEINRQIIIMKNIDELSPLGEDAMAELGKIVKQKMLETNSGRIPINGKNKLIKILPFANASLRTIIQQNVPSLAGIPVPNKTELPFESLAKMPDKHFQKLLKEVERKTLLQAIKIEADSFRSKMRNNMTQNAIEMIEIDLNDLGPVKKSDILNAQNKICNLAKEMEKAGSLVLVESNDWVN